MDSYSHPNYKKLRLYRRKGSSRWQASVYFEGANRRLSTKEVEQTRAELVAGDWYEDLLASKRLGQSRFGPTFEQAACLFRKEYEALVKRGDRSERHFEQFKNKLKRYLNPFFGKMNVIEITTARVADYEQWRLKNNHYGTSPSRATMHQEFVLIRHVLKTASIQGWIDNVPTIGHRHKQSQKQRFRSRSWFTFEEYKKLIESSQKRVLAAEGKRWQWAVEQLHDYIIFMVNTGLRVGEASNLRYADIEIKKNKIETDARGKPLEYLLISAVGKRGHGECVSFWGAVSAYKNLLQRNDPKESDLVFPTYQRIALNNLLDETGLKVDAYKNVRSASSFRSTYISFRLLGGAPIYEIALNCH